MSPIAFVIGPPGAGKTTISRLAAYELGWTFKTIDDWTPRRKGMSDVDVDQALSRLFDDVGTHNELVEFCYHDYATLLSTQNYHQFVISRKILIFAPLDVCRARNIARSSAVADLYLERAWRSSEELLSREFLDGEFTVLESGAISVDAAVALMVGWLRACEGDRNGS